MRDTIILKFSDTQWFNWLKKTFLFDCIALPQTNIHAFAVNEPMGQAASELNREGFC